MCEPEPFRFSAAACLASWAARNASVRLACWFDFNFIPERRQIRRQFQEKRAITLRAMGGRRFGPTANHSSQNTCATPEGPPAAVPRKRT